MYTGTGCRNQSNCHGLDYGYLQHAERSLYTGCRDRKALGAGRSCWPKRSHGAGCDRSLCRINLIRALDLDISSCTAAIQGFGNVGSTTARLLYESGVRILAVSDVSGGVFCESGLPIVKILEFCKSGALLKESCVKDSSVTFLSNDKLLALPVTFLIPRALENQINRTNLETIHAQYIVEAANGPVSMKPMPPA